MGVYGEIEAVVGEGDGLAILEAVEVALTKRNLDVGYGNNLSARFRWAVTDMGETGNAYCFTVSGDIGEVALAYGRLMEAYDALVVAIAKANGEERQALEVTRERLIFVSWEDVRYG